MSVMENNIERESINLEDSPIINIQGDKMEYSPIRTQMMKVKIEKVVN